MKRFLPLLIVSALIPQAAHATRTVTSPYVDENVLKLKLKYGVTTDDDSASRDGAVSGRAEAEYGVTDRLSLISETDIENAGNDDNTNIPATSVKAKYLFTEKGKYWLDVGARVSYEFNLEGEDGPDAVEAKLLLSKDSEKWRHMANVIFDREVGEDAANDTNFGLSWSTRYKVAPEFEPGFEMYNNFGSLSENTDFEEEDHSIGPMVYGKIGDVKYEFGYMAGFSEAAADGRLKGVIEYAIKF